MTTSLSVLANAPQPNGGYRIAILLPGGKGCAGGLSFRGDSGMAPGMSGARCCNFRHAILARSFARIGDTWVCLVWVLPTWRPTRGRRNAAALQQVAEGPIVACRQVTPSALVG